MHSSIRNMSIEGTTQTTRAAPTIDRLIQEVTFLTVSCNQTVTQTQVALATNPCSKDDTGICNSDLLIELAQQLSHHASRLQFKHTKTHDLQATSFDLNLQQYPLLDESLPISLTCTTTFLGFAADRCPNRVAVDVEISQGKQACCYVGFTQVSRDGARQLQNDTHKGRITTPQKHIDSKINSTTSARR